jgi:hypothetical protein
VVLVLPLLIQITVPEQIIIIYMNTTIPEQVMQDNSILLGQQPTVPALEDIPVLAHLTATRIQVMLANVQLQLVVVQELQYITVVVLAVLVRVAILVPVLVVFLKIAQQKLLMIQTEGMCLEPVVMYMIMLLVLLLLVLFLLHILILVPGQITMD